LKTEHIYNVNVTQLHLSDIYFKIHKTTHPIIIFVLAFRYYFLKLKTIQDNLCLWV